MNFKQWAEQQLSLPAIPPEMIRLTHFTSGNIAKRILQGQPFLYKAIDSTTDSFSNNQDVIDLIQQGGYGAFNRSHFGDHVLLIDLPYGYHRRHRRNAPQGYVDNASIVGVIDRNNMSFIPNRRYNPSSVKIPKTKEIDSPYHRPQPTDIPQPQLGAGTEVW